MPHFSALGFPRTSLENIFHEKVGERKITRRVESVSHEHGVCWSFVDRPSCVWDELGVKNPWEIVVTATAYLQVN